MGVLAETSARAEACDQETLSVSRSLRSLRFRKASPVCERVFFFESFDRDSDGDFDSDSDPDSDPDPDPDSELERGRGVQI